MNACPDTREELDKVSSLVLAARRLLASGTLVDLAAVEERVRAICGRVEVMPRDEGQSLLAAMEGLIARLDQLANDLEEHLRQIGAPQGGGG